MKIDLAFGEKCEVYLDADRVVKKYNLDLADFEYIDGRALHLENNGQTKFVMFLNSTSYKTIAHEASHIADYACGFFTIKDDEFKAYMVGHIVDQVVYKLGRLK